LKLSKQNSNDYDAIEQKKKEFKAARKIQGNNSLFGENSRQMQKLLEYSRDTLLKLITIKFLLKNLLFS